MLSKAMQDAINEQIKNELYSSYLYLAMSAYCEANNLPGFAHWLRVQSQEEIEHAIKVLEAEEEKKRQRKLKQLKRQKEQEDALEQARKLIKSLKKIDKKIVYLRIWMKMPWKDVGRWSRMKGTSARQRYYTALKNMNKYSKFKYLMN